MRDADGGRRVLTSACRNAAATTESLRAASRLSHCEGDVHAGVHHGRLGSDRSPPGSRAAGRRRSARDPVAAVRRWSGASRDVADYQVVQGDPTTEGRWEEEVDGCDAVVNLAGHNLFADRWNTEVKRKIRDSRVHGTEHVVAAIARPSNEAQGSRPGSAIGYYGPHGDEELTRRARRARTSWRSSAASGKTRPSRSAELGVRLAMVRTGIVLAPGEGALAFMTPIFKLGPRCAHRQRRQACSPPASSG